MLVRIRRVFVNVSGSEYLSDSGGNEAVISPAVAGRPDVRETSRQIFRMSRSSNGLRLCLLDNTESISKRPKPDNLSCTQLDPAKGTVDKVPLP